MDFICENNLLPLKYKFAVEKLSCDIKNATKLGEIRKLFYEFSQIYTVIPALWLEWLRLEQNHRFPDFKLSELKNRRKKIKQLAKTHFYSKKYFILDKSAIETGNFEQSLHFPWLNYFKIAVSKYDEPNFTTQGLEKALCFPHSELKNVLEFCSKWAVRPIPTTTVMQYKKSLKTYEKIVDNNSDHEAWFSSLQETNNENFIIQNFEYRLGENPLDTKLWKLYLKYLNEKQPIAALDLYSKYCRLFIEDLGMKKKYWNLISLIGGFKKDVLKWWIDCIKMEKSFETFDSAFLFLKKILSSKSIHPELFLEYLFWFENIFPNRTCFKNLKDQFPTPQNLGMLQYPRSNSNHSKILNSKTSSKNSFTSNLKQIPKQSLQDAVKNFYQNYSCQDFSLPSTVTYYMLNVCNSEILSKFQKSCKYFYCRKFIPLCHKLTVTDSPQNLLSFNQQSLSINSSSLNSKYLNYLKITNTLYINCSNDFKAFSKLCSTNVKFDIRHLHLINQDLTIEELEKVSCLKIQSLDLQNVTIKNKNGKNLPIEDIIVRFPASSSINLCLTEFTPKTAQKLAELNRSCKLEYFKICNLEESFEAKYFAQFILKNYTKETKSVISFSPDTDMNYKNAFEKYVKKAIKCWKNAG